MYVLYLFFFSYSYFFLSFLPLLLLFVCTLWIQLNDLLSKYISRASLARVDTFVSISFHRLICYKITFSCLINFYALKHTHTYTHFLSLALTDTHRRLQQAFTCVDIAFCIREIFPLSLSCCVFSRYAKYARLAQFSHWFSWLAAHIFYDILRFCFCFFI